MKRPEDRRQALSRFGVVLVVLVALSTLVLTFGSHAAPVSVTVSYSPVPVADGDLDGNPGTGDWSGASQTTIPLENNAASPYGSATLIAKHDGTYYFFRIDGSIDVPWASAGGNHFWLGMQISPTGTSHHGGGTWDGTFFGLWDGTDYAPQPAYPPTPVDTNGFTRPPSKDASQDDLGAMRYSGASAPYSFTVEWKKKLNSGDASDIAYSADGTTTYNFFVTTDSDGQGSSGGSLTHKGTTNLNTMTFAAPSSPNTPPQADLTAPDGGEDWSGGSSHPIWWNMSDAETPTPSLVVWINYSTDGGSSYGPIAGAQGLTGLSNPCSFLWALPAQDTTSARVRVTVADARGATAVDASLATFRIDAVAPTVTAFSPPDGATGVGTTTQVRVTFSESMNTASAEQAFSLKRVDTGAYVSGSFAWSANDLVFSPSSALAGGLVYRTQVNATARDVSVPGNALGAAAGASFTTIDATAPTIAGVSAAPSPQESGGAVNISASVTDNGMVSEVWIEVRGPGGAVVANVSAAYDTGSGRYFYEAAYTSPGTYTFRISAKDAAGNWAVATGSFSVVDTTPPTIQHVPVTQAVVSAPIRISALLSDVDAVAAARVDYTDVLGSRSNVSMTLVGSVYQVDLPGQPLIGTLTYFVWAADPSGNAARTPDYVVDVVGIDSTPPGISGLAAAPPIQDSGYSVNLSASVSDNIALGSVRISVSDPQGGSLGNVSMLRLGVSDTFYYERTYASLGVYDAVLWATDASGNAASAALSFEIVDRLAPVIEWASVTPPSAEAGTPVNITASVIDNVGVSQVRIEVRDSLGGTILAQAMAGASGLYWMEATFRLLGDFTFILNATDAAGNAGGHAGSFTMVDTQPPVAVAGADSTVWVGSPVTFDASASSDNSAIVNVTWSFPYNGTDVSLYGNVVGFTFDLTGAYDVTLTVVDAAGLSGTATVRVTVTTDTSAPPAPSNVQVAATSASCLRIDWETASAQDVSGYRVYRWNETRQAFDLLDELPASDNSYTDCGLEADLVYRYWVVAVDAYGNASPPSAIVDGRTTASPVTVSGPDPIYQVVLVVVLVLLIVLVAVWAGRRGRTPPGSAPK